MPATAAAQRPFDSAQYWETRYAHGGHSGAGSYGRLAEFKAEVINALIAREGLHDVIELGCGDGNQLSLLDVATYRGYDVSETVLARCRQRFAGDSRKSFAHIQALGNTRADLALSLDVIYHLVEDDVYEGYLRQLFDCARRLVVIYASDPADDTPTANAHVRHRAVSRWVARHRPDYRLIDTIDNRFPLQADPQHESFAHFMVFARQPAAEAPARPAVAQLDPLDLARLPATRQVVAGMATVAGNEAALTQAVASLLPQVDRIELYCNGFTAPPAGLDHEPKVVCHLDPDGRRWGDAGKFHGLATSDDAIYLSCDDDLHYPPDYVQRMVATLADHQGRAVATVHGALLRQPFDNYYAGDARAVLHFERALALPRRVHVAGTGTAAFHTACVRPSMAVFAHPNMADTWLAVHAQQQGLPVVAVPRPAKWLRQLPMQRSSIYEQGARRAGDGLDTGRLQAGVLQAAGTITLLASGQADVLLIHLTVRTRQGLTELLASLNRAPQDVVLVVRDALGDPPLTAADLAAYTGELHRADDDRMPTRLQPWIGGMTANTLELVALPDGPELRVVTPATRS